MTASAEQIRRASFLRGSQRAVLWVAICLVYLVVIPPSFWGVAVSIGLAAGLAIEVLCREEIIAGVASAVLVMAVDGVGSYQGQGKLIPRFFNAFLGVAIGFTAWALGMNIPYQNTCDGGKL